jgi:hypothetical protein
LLDRADANRWAADQLAPLPPPAASSDIFRDGQ